MSLWTREEVEKVLIKLDEINGIFKGYCFTKDGDELNLLGMGASAHVYEAQSRNNVRKKYAIKVIGFKKQYLDENRHTETVVIQKKAGFLQDNIVKLYKNTELWLGFDNDGNLIEVERKRDEIKSNQVLNVQFVLMEKIEAVIRTTMNGKKELMPQKLADGDEEEILTLAYDIGRALINIHGRGILHRDIKLENVFYCKNKRQYRLGDFGISKKTERGFANTIAFTKGYVAPEVGITEESYDKTADIYSFGMMLYVLMNNLKFPGSNSYSVNASVQYCSGYVVPFPDGNISVDFYNVIAKACMYDADKRYQDVSEMLTDIEEIIYGNRPGYKKRHKKLTVVVGSIFLSVGILASKLLIFPQVVISVTSWEIIFLLIGLSKSIIKVFNKSVAWINVVLFGVGIYLLCTTEFSWIKLVFMLVVLCFNGITGYLAGGCLLVIAAAPLQKVFGLDISIYSEYSWVFITMITLAVILLLEAGLMEGYNRRLEKQLHKYEIFWIGACVYYMMYIWEGLFRLNSQFRVNRFFFGEYIANYLVTVDILKVGTAGLIFCLLWALRVNIMIMLNKRSA